MPTKATHFVTSFLSEFLETRLANGMIDTDEYNDLVAALKADPRIAVLSAKLFKKSPRAVRPIATNRTCCTPSPAIYGFLKPLRASATD